MQTKKTLSAIFVALMLCSSIMLVSFNHAQVTPLGCDLYAENNTDVYIASVNFVSSLDNKTLSNIPPSFADAGMLNFDDQDAITITVTFSQRIPRNAIARIYNMGSTNQVGTINIAAGATGGTTRIYPPIGGDAIYVIVDYN
jgi:hypothetical protein